MGGNDMTANAGTETNVSEHRHLPECDMNLCFIRQDTECQGELSCWRPGCNQWCTCQKLRRAFSRGWKAGQEAQEATTLSYGKRKYREGLVNSMRAVNTEFKARIQREQQENDPDGLLNGLLYAHGKILDAINELF